MLSHTFWMAQLQSGISIHTAVEKTKDGENLKDYERSDKLLDVVDILNKQIKYRENKNMSASAIKLAEECGIKLILFPDGTVAAESPMMVEHSFSYPGRCGLQEDLEDY